MDFHPETLERLRLLKEKYAAMGQDLNAYLDGLLYADYMTYWDYIHLDTLLSLQNPKTSFPDETIFIAYHQITELYFKLSLHAIEQLAETPSPDVSLLKRQVGRVNTYFRNLVHSFDIMVDGLDKTEFLQFRMSLLPSSGFQSAQYRMLEIMSTPMHHLVRYGDRASVSPEMTKQEMYERLYWKRGATELATGNKTLTLKQFEAKYTEQLIRLAEQYEKCNLWQLFQQLSPEDQADEALRAAYRELDQNANVRWGLSHYRAAVRHLNRQPVEIAATGGTNWQEYLPPKNQLVVFFPDLWTEEELDNWGKQF